MARSTKTKFQDSWLIKIDSNGTAVSEWAEKDPKNVYNTHCKICDSSFLSEKGFEKINQHASTQKHKNNLFKLKPNQLQLIAANTSAAIESRSEQPNQEFINSSNTNQEQNNLMKTQSSLFNKQDAASRAEIYYLLEVVNSNSPLSTCDGKKELFQVMFPDCVPKGFTLSRTKASYLLNYALGPYFKNLLLTELQEYNVHFTLQFDETGNVKSKKEMQIRVQYWSNSQNIIVNRHLVTFFIEKGDGDTLFQYLLEALESNNLSLKNVLTLGKDGPNVNKKVFRLFQERLKSLNYKQLYDVGSCLLHAAHNAFLKGMQSFSLDVSDLLIKLYYYFHNQHLRCENFKQFQSLFNLPEHMFFKHCSTRWLTLGPAAERVVEQLPALHEYFLKYIPQKENSTTKKQSYIDIINYLKDPLFKPVLEFTVYASKIFTAEFTEKMQKNEPLIHILHSQLQKLIFILCCKVVKSAFLKVNDKLLDLKCSEILQNSNLYDLKEITIGEKVKKSVLVLSELNKLSFFKEVQNFHLKSISYMFEKINNLKTLKYFKCLVPENIKRTSSTNYIVKIANLLPLNNVDVDILTQEWQLLQIDSEVSFVSKEDQRIDEYWFVIFSLKNPPSFRYPLITRVVKASLSLTHGSADVERGFSQSGRALTDDRVNMTVETLNARLTVLDGLKKFDCKPYKVPITNELLKLARTAYRSYQSHLDEQNRLEEMKKKKKEEEIERENKEKAILQEVKEQIESVKNLGLQLQEEEKIYKKMIEESDSMQEMLRKANCAKSKTSLGVLQQLISGLENLRKKEKEQRSKVENLRGKVLKRKSKIFETAVNKKLKIN